MNFFFFFWEHSKYFCEQLDPYAITVRIKHLNIVHHINWIAPSSAKVVASVEIYIWNLYLTLACGKHSAAGIDCYSQTGQLFPLWIGIRFRLTTLQQSQNRRNQSLSQFVVKSLNSSVTENSILFWISNKFKEKKDWCGGKYHRICQFSIAEVWKAAGTNALLNW